MSEAEMKICKKCEQEKPLRDFQRKSGSGPSLCASCFREKDRAWQKAYHKRPEVVKRKNEYRKSPKMVEWSKEYKRRPEVMERERLHKQDWEVSGHGRSYRGIPEVADRKAERQKAYNSAQAEKITDAYVRGRIRAKTKGVIKAKDAPLHLIELQRELISLNREIAQKKQEHEQHTTADV